MIAVFRTGADGISAVDPPVVAEAPPASKDAPTTPNIGATSFRRLCLEASFAFGIVASPMPLPNVGPPRHYLPVWTRRKVDRRLRRTARARHITALRGNSSRMRGANPVRHVVNRTVAPTRQDDPFHSRQHKHHTYRSISHSICGCARTVINHNCRGGGAISPSRRLRVCRRIIGDDNPLGLSSNTAGHPISTPGLLKLRSLGREMY